MISDRITHSPEQLLLQTHNFPLAEIEWRKKKLQEEDEFEDLTEEAATLQEQELEKVCTERRSSNTLHLWSHFSDSADAPVCLFVGNPDPVQPGPSDPEGGEGGEGEGR